MWNNLRDGFIEYLKSRRYSDNYVSDIVSYLDKYINVISCPQDIIDIFKRVQRGRRHLMLGLRVLFRYAEVIGYDKGFLDSLRAALPRCRCNVDLKVPTEEEIINSLKKLSGVALKYRCLFNLLLDSGLRLKEAVKLINDFEGAEEVNGFYRCKLGFFRGSKRAFYAYFTKHTMKFLEKIRGEKLNDKAASTYFRKKKLTNPKYLRKFAFDKMIELGIPESVADFIQGRVARSIGAKHYMALRRQADKHYAKYATYLAELRAKTAKNAPLFAVVARLLA